MITVLVSGASGIVGYGCLKSLRRLNDCRLIGTSIYDSPVARNFSDIFLRAPHTSSDEYITWLINVIRQYQIDVLIPGIEIDMYTWNDNRTLIEQEAVTLLLNSMELINICADKWKFYLRLKQEMEGITIPTFIEHDYCKIIERVGSPFVMKTRNGYGSQGVKIINDELEYQYYRTVLGPDAMVQKFIDGDEYTIGAFFDGQASLKASICMKRKLSKGGFTEEAEIVNVPEIDNIIIRLGEIFKPVGPTNFQFIKDETGFMLLEINPRVSSSNYMRTQFGYNECLMSIDYFVSNKEIIQPSIRTGKVARFIEEVVEYDRDYI